MIAGCHLDLGRFTAPNKRIQPTVSLAALGSPAGDARAVSLLSYGLVRPIQVKEI